MKDDQEPEQIKNLNLFRLKINSTAQNPKPDLKTEIYGKDNYMWPWKQKELDDKMLSYK
jgi:hypothetical protein